MKMFTAKSLVVLVLICELQCMSYSGSNYISISRTKFAHYKIRAQIAMLANVTHMLHYHFARKAHYSNYCFF